MRTKIALSSIAILAMLCGCATDLDAPIPPHVPPVVFHPTPEPKTNLPTRPITSDTTNPPRTLAEAKKTFSERKLTTETSNILVSGPSSVKEYDTQLVRSVRESWFDLIESQSRAHKRGRIIVEFQLFHDGRISNIKIVENQCSELEAILCEAAISKTSPFHRWPDDLRQELKTDVREVRFTFNYE